MSQLDLVLSILKKRLSVLYRSRLVEIILFGSQAKKTADEESDVDVLIVLADRNIRPGIEIDRMIDIIHELHMTYNFVIQVVPISVFDFENSRLPLVQNIRQDGIHV